MRRKKQRIKREVYGGNKYRNIEEKIFVIFEISKESKKERKLLATNY